MKFIQDKYGYNYVMYPKSVRKLMDIYTSFCFSESVNQPKKLIVMLASEDEQFGNWLNINSKQFHNNLAGIIILNENSKFLNMDKESFETIINHPKLAKRQIIQYEEKYFQEFNYLLFTYFKEYCVFHKDDFLANKIITEVHF